MKLRLRMPVRIYAGLCGRFSLQDRECSVLKIPLNPPCSADVEVVCGVADAKLLLDRAKQFYPEAVPYIEDALNLGQSGLMIELIRGS